MKLFISYSRDDKAWVALLWQALRDENFDAWMDRFIDPVANWWETILKNIYDADCFIYVMTPKSIESPYCQAELNYALDRGVPVLALMLKRCEFPKRLNDANVQYEVIQDGMTLDRVLFRIGKGLNHAEKVTHRNDVKFPNKPGADQDPAEALLIAEDAVSGGNFAEAIRLLEEVKAKDDGILGEIATEKLAEVRALEACGREYTKVKRLVAGNSADLARRAWAAYQRSACAGYDPDNIAAQFENTPPPDPVGATRRVAPTTESPLIGQIQQAHVPTPRIDPIADALERARNFKGTRNSEWTPFITTFPELAIPDMEWCLVPCGSFMMGDDNGKYDEKPAHPQTFNQPYWIARYPVTNAQWAVAVKAGAVPEPQGDSSSKWYKDKALAHAPVVGVDWFASVAFSAWLNAPSLNPSPTGRGTSISPSPARGGGQGEGLVRLPTEREWEYAARGVSNLVYPWGNDWEDGQRVIWSGNSGGQPNPVTNKPEGASWVGALHLSGNVWEWCSSLYKPYPYKGDDGREDNVNRTDYRIVRGGSFISNRNRAACAYRGYNVPSSIDYACGQRFVVAPLIGVSGL
jgi:iron(II)-dependent oxidoreductase